MMSFVIRYLFFKPTVLLTCFLVGSIVGCQSIKPNDLSAYSLTKIFPANGNLSTAFDESIIASPLLDLSQGRALVIVPVSNGEIFALNGTSGAIEWKIKVPTPKGQQPQLISTPLILNNKLIALYQCIEKGVRTSHRIAVIDLINKKLDENFPTLVLSAEKPSADGKSTVRFNPPTAFSHSALKHAAKAGQEWGKLYAAFGNSGDAQPFHGWLFEIDLNAWQTTGIEKAVSAVMTTTPEIHCPVTMEYGTQEMICGGGIWTPEGPQIYPAKDGYELYVPVGNGQVDLSRKDYSNSLMRLQPGLKFDAACDKQLCSNFDPKQPDLDCLNSCKNLFIPRLSSSDAPLKPANHECDSKTFWECLAWMDYDLGASSPVKIDLKNGPSVLVQPGKEGAVYLIDAEHLGTQYDRLQIVDICGSPQDECKANWMGMIVTHPALTSVNNVPIVIIPVFIPDKTHPAGVVALKIDIENGKPKFRHFWQFPDPASGKARTTFRSHPSFPIISTLMDGEKIVWLVDIGEHGALYGLRVKDGALVFQQSLLGAGRQLSTPLIYKDSIYLASIIPSTGKAFVEAYKIEMQE